MFDPYKLPRICRYMIMDYTQKGLVRQALDVAMRRDTVYEDIEE